MAMENMSWYWPLSAWMSPGAALFLLCNVLIGAIAVTSSRGERGGRAAASTRRLCRSASSMVLDRLRSFSMFSDHTVPFEEGYDDHPSLEVEEDEQRQQPQPAVAESGTPAAPASAPAAAAASATSSESAAAEEVAPEAGKDKPVCSEEAQAPAWQSSPPPAAFSAAAAAEATAASERPATVAGSIMQRARACRREVEGALEGRAALNARAELFIQQFREDLKLQRLNSIINYTRALRRGASAAPAAGQ